MVSITVSGHRVVVRSPFHPDFPPAAHRLDGVFENPVWVFDVRDLERVRELCRALFGDDGTPQERVTLQVRCRSTWSADRAGLFLAGRAVARAFSRDSGARSEQGVVVLDGPGFDSGGSVRNWTTRAGEGTVFELRDVPLLAAKRVVADPPAQLSVTIQRGALELVSRRAALEAEREQLLERLAQIERELGAQAG